MNDLEYFARLIQALKPWRDSLVFAGGWAHRLHRLHSLASVPGHEPIRTRDTDIVFDAKTGLKGDVRAALSKAAFNEELSSDHKPPVTHYTLGDEGAGFYAEFLTPLQGSGVKRNGEVDATMTAGGVTAQKLRHLDLLLIEPWRVWIGAEQGVPLPKPTDVLVVNPTAFIAQKLLIQKYRSPEKQAQDVLYIHDTIELFGASLTVLNTAWTKSLRPTLSAKTAKRVLEVSDSTFSSITDVIRDAVRIPQDRKLAPDRMRTLCQVGLKRILD